VKTVLYVDETGYVNVYIIERDTVIIDDSDQDYMTDEVI
jgi:hypothetical protein